MFIAGVALLCFLVRLCAGLVRFAAFPACDLFCEATFRVFRCHLVISFFGPDAVFLPERSRGVDKAVGCEPAATSRILFLVRHSPMLGAERRGGVKCEPRLRSSANLPRPQKLFGSAWLGIECEPASLCGVHSGVHPGPRAVECELARSGLVGLRPTHTPLACRRGGCGVA